MYVYRINVGPHAQRARTQPCCRVVAVVSAKSHDLDSDRNSDKNKPKHEKDEAEGL